MMRFGLAGIAVLLLALAFAASPAAAAIDSYMKIDGIPGGAREMQHMGWFEIEDFSFDVEQTLNIGSGGAGAGKARFGEIKIVKQVDVASPKLFQACASGKHFPKIVIESMRRGQTRHIELEDVVIASVRAVPDGDAGRRLEEITLRYERMSEQAPNMMRPNAPMPMMQPVGH